MRQRHGVDLEPRRFLDDLAGLRVVFDAAADHALDVEIERAWNVQAAPGIFAECVFVRLRVPGERVPHLRSAESFRRLPFLDVPGRNSAEFENRMSASADALHVAVNRLSFGLSPNENEVRFAETVEAADGVQ